MKRAVIGTIFLIVVLCAPLTSCHSFFKSKKIDQWEFRSVKSSYFQFHSGKIYFPEKPKDNVQIELVRSANGVQLYFNFFSVPIPSKTKLKLSWDDKTTDFINAEILKGGQKVLIPDSFAKKIIANLDNNQSFDLSIGIYQTRITSHNFKEAYRELCSLKLEKQIASGV